MLKLDFNERSDKLSRLADDDRYAQSLWRYPERQQLESKLATLYDVSEDQLLCTNGGDEAIMILMRIIKETSRLILPLPAFSQYTWGLKSWLLDCQQVEANEDLSINIEATGKAIQSNPGAVTIITRPNNPTGESIGLADLKSLISAASQNKGWVFLDEAYIEFSDLPTTPSSLLNEFDNLVILRTFSKAYGLAGIRLGYIMGASALIEEFRRRCMPFNVPQPSIEIACQALDDDNRQEVKIYCETIAANRRQLNQWLSQNNIAALKSDANFVMLQLPDGQAQAVSRFLKRRGILVRTFSDKALVNCLRITIPFQLEPLLALLKQALRPSLICLDMDGVLIDTSDSYDATVQATVKELSGQDISLKDIFRLRDSGGFNNDWVLSQQLLKNLGFDFALAQVTEIFQSIYLGDKNDGLVQNEKPLIQPSTASKLKSLANTKIAIVTGRPSAEALAGSQLVELAPVDIISLDDVTTAKPDPEGIIKLQKKYSNSSWMCGDNPDDMQAAVGSNSLAVGIGKRNADALYAAGADIVFEDINQIVGWLEPGAKC